MSDNLPLEIQEDIIKRLRARSLIQFRSVSKVWKSRIDSSHFIKHYSSQQQHLLVTYDDPLTFEGNYVSVVDDNTFPEQKVSLTLPLMFKYASIVGTSHGLFCLYGDHRMGRGGYFSGTGKAVLWNPLIRKAVVVDVPNMANGIYETSLGFGVCRETVDPKIVKITHECRWIYMGSSSCIPWQVEVFTLSTGVWRSPYSNLPHKSIHFDYNRVVIDGVLYWLATDRMSVDGGFSSYNLIISFDMTSEEFREVNLPDSLAHQSCLSIFELKKSLVVIECDRDFLNPDIVVWKMEDDVTRSFTKLFVINTPHQSMIYVRGFRKTGEPIIDFTNFNPRVAGSLAVYEHYSKSINDLEINGRDAFVYS